MNQVATAAVLPTETPLYGHTSAESAYQIADYPYGFRLRCQMRVWLERKPGHGFRMVTQTTNPKAGDRWNKPKAGTYCDLAACLYLDSEGHIQWTGLGFYSDAHQVKRFAERFPGIAPDMRATLRVWCGKKAAFARGCLEGKVTMTVNDKVVPWTEADDARHRAELAAWLEAAALLA